MHISKEELRTYNNYVIYKEGYRILYYYINYHEAPRAYYAEKIEDFVNFFKDDNIKFNSIDDLLDRFLELNKKALGVAIYSVDGKCIGKKIKPNIKKINDSVVYKDELIYDYNKVIAKEGYRLVYFKNDNSYYIGTYSKTIEGFMLDLCDCEPIFDEDEIPKFVSIDDMLERTLKFIPDYNAVALYDVDGNCLRKKDRNKENII